MDALGLEVKGLEHLRMWARSGAGLKSGCHMARKRSPHLGPGMEGSNGASPIHLFRSKLHRRSLPGSCTSSERYGAVAWEE